MEPPPLQPTLPDKLSTFLKCRRFDPRSIHALSLKLGCLCSTFLCNNLIHAYSSRSMLVDARSLFDEIPHRTDVSWSAMISGYAHMGRLRDAILFFNGMQKSLYFNLPNEFTFGSIVTGCTRVRNLRTGVQMHCSILKAGVEPDTFVAGTLIDMYAKCGRIDEAWRMFDQTPDKDVVSWTSIISCLANSSRDRYRDAAFGLVKEMIRVGVQPVGMTFASVVKVFDEPKKLKQAKQAHGYMVKLGVEVDHLLGSSLIAMYGRCGRVDEAVRLSARLENDVVLWTSLLVAYVQNGYNIEAIKVFRKMLAEKIMIDPFVIASAIGACSALEEAAKGKEIHGFALRNSLLLDLSVGNALITFYGRCSEVVKAERVFWMMGDRDIISWTAMLTCYGQNGCGEEAVSFFQQMLQEGLNPPVFCVTGAIRACSKIESFFTGRQMHSRTVIMGIDTNLSVENSLITMYANCGIIEDALRVFSSMIERDIITWNALITGFSHHGLEKEALRLFNMMAMEGIQPDDYTFVGLLVSCSRGGLIAEGCKYFRLMNEVYGLEPKMEHYACMVDLFGRAGRLQNALDFIYAMPCDPDHLIWEALLASCKTHGDIELGKFAAKKILEMGTEDSSPYIALSSIHASMGMWDRKASFWNMMRDQGVQKVPARSWVESRSWLEDTYDALQVGET